MSPNECQPGRVSRPQPNQVDEWQTVSFNYGFMRDMSCRLTLTCGHQIPLAIQYARGQGAGALMADDAARRKLLAAIAAQAAAHDCTAYTRQRTLAAVTARLKE